MIFLSILITITINIILFFVIFLGSFMGSMLGLSFILNIISILKRKGKFELPSSGDLTAGGYATMFPALFISILSVYFSWGIYAFISNLIYKLLNG